MYIYHVLINALSAHMIHINLNMIFYTHVERSPTETIYIKYYTKQQQQQQKRNTLETHTHMHACTHTHARTHACTHSDRSRNWVLILGWKYCEKRKVFSLALKEEPLPHCFFSFSTQDHTPYRSMYWFHSPPQYFLMDSWFIHLLSTFLWIVGLITSSALSYG